MVSTFDGFWRQLSFFLCLRLNIWNIELKILLEKSRKVFSIFLVKEPEEKKL